MGASLAWAVSQTPQASAWIIALADMPFIQPATIAQVADAIRRPEALVVPVFREQRGHPVGFGQAYLEELVALTGDEGARSILHRHVEQVQWLVCDDPGVIKDIDTPADLRPMAP
jgi:molybdenum cofactor cytidylyltransferase